MELINTTISEENIIKGFSKDEILDLKRNIEKYKSNKSDQSELRSFIQETFSMKILNSHIRYISDLRIFIENYFAPFLERNTEEISYFKVLTEKLNLQLSMLLKSVQNISLNCKNTKRFIKQDKYLENYLSETTKLMGVITGLQKILNNSNIQSEETYWNASKLWVEIELLKDTQLMLKELPEVLLSWKEVLEVKNRVYDIQQKSSEKKIFKKDSSGVIFSFKQFCGDLQNSVYDLDLLYDITYLLYLNGYIVLPEDFNFKNVIDRKDIKKNLDNFLTSLIQKMSSVKLSQLSQEFGKKVKDNSIFEIQNKKLNEFFSDIIDTYLNYVEEEIQSRYSELENFKKSKEYQQEYIDKIDYLANIISSFKISLRNLSEFFSPYEMLIENKVKLFDGMEEDISRRKENFKFFLESYKEEKIKEEIRTYLKEKIKDLDEILEDYRDDVSCLLKQDFPHLDKMKEVLTTFDQRVKEVKDLVHKKITDYAQSDLGQFKIIKEWEEELKKKNTQMSFLLSQLLSNFYKYFEDLIEKENTIFRELNEIKESTENDNQIPLNYIISDILAEKLSEEELRERIIEIKAKINQINDLSSLYNHELHKLEGVLKKKVQLREGIISSDIQCTICRKNIDLAKDNIIKCPYCGAIYHYLCVAFWLSKYNSCPSCQNVFLEPNSGMFELEK